MTTCNAAANLPGDMDSSGTYYLLFTADCSLLTAYCLLLTTCNAAPNLPGDMDSSTDYKRAAPRHSKRRTTRGVSKGCRIMLKKHAQERRDTVIRTARSSQMYQICD